MSEAPYLVFMCEATVLIIKDGVPLTRISIPGMIGSSPEIIDDFLETGKNLKENVVNKLKAAGIPVPTGSLIQPASDLPKN